MKFTRIVIELSIPDNTVDIEIDGMVSAYETLDLVDDIKDLTIGRLMYRQELDPVFVSIREE